MPKPIESHSSEPEPSDAFSASPAWADLQTQREAAAGPPTYRAALPRGHAVPRELLVPDRRRELLSFLLAYRSEVIAGEVAGQLRNRSLLLDAATLAARTAGTLAAKLEDPETFADTLRIAAGEIIDAALEELRHSPAHEAGAPGEFTILGSAQSARRACREFNRLGDGERAALFRLAVLGQEPAEAASALGATIPTILETARLALARIEAAIALGDAPSQRRGDEHAV